jgi:hypothetical protein
MPKSHLPHEAPVQASNPDAAWDPIGEMPPPVETSTPPLASNTTTDVEELRALLQALADTAEPGTVIEVIDPESWGLS